MNVIKNCNSPDLVFLTKVKERDSDLGCECGYVFSTLVDTQYMLIMRYLSNLV